jgi:hypothetical protein
MTSDGSDDRQICHDDAAYVLGALSPADRRAYEEHLRECAACQASVRSLAGLPGLLALTSEDALTGAEQPVPPSVMSGVLRRVQRARRRRVMVVSGLAAAAAVLMVIVVWAVVRPEATPSAQGGAAATGPASASPSPSAVPVPDETVPLAQVLPGPMTATLELDDKRWGTAITVICSYDEGMRTSVPYDLAVVDVDGHESSAGSWSGVPGVTARIPVATAVPRERISAFEIRLSDGRTILRGAP